MQQMLKNIANMKGTEEIYRYVEKYNINLEKKDINSLRDLKDYLGNKPSFLVADEGDDE